MPRPHLCFLLDFHKSLQSKYRYSDFLVTEAYNLSLAKGSNTGPRIADRSYDLSESVWNLPQPLCLEEA
jgi:hypothetical protein